MGPRELPLDLGGGCELVRRILGTAVVLQLFDEAVLLVHKDHPRLEELSDDVAFFIETKKAKNLDEAYDLACRLNPAPVATSQAADQTATNDLAAQTRKGGKSISGAPTPGSDPVTKRASTSIKDSIRRAVAQTG